MLHPNNRRLVHTKGPSGQLRCRAIVQPARHVYKRCSARWAARLRAHAARRNLFFGACLPGFAVSISRSVLQAKEAVANLPLRLAVRVHCGHQVRRGTLGVLIHSGGKPGVLTACSRVLTQSTGMPPWDNTQRGMRCCRQSAPSLVLLPARARVRLNDRMCGCRGWSCS